MPGRCWNLSILRCVGVFGAVVGGAAALRLMRARLRWVGVGAGCAAAPDGGVGVLLDGGGVCGRGWPQVGQ